MSANERAQRAAACGYLNERLHTDGLVNEWRTRCGLGQAAEVWLQEGAPIGHFLLALQTLNPDVGVSIDGIDWGGGRIIREWWVIFEMVCDWADMDGCPIPPSGGAA